MDMSHTKNNLKQNGHVGFVSIGGIASVIQQGEADVDDMRFSE